MQSTPFKRIDWMKRCGVTTFVDVGANVGQTGLDLRRSGWEGPIHSFEPLPACFDQLKQVSQADPLWFTYNLALGAANGTARISVAESPVTSSLRPATPELHRIYGGVREVEEAEVRVARLDGVLPDLLGPEDVAYLKIDTQGYEREVVAGTRAVLDRCHGVQMEVAVSEVYRGEMLLPEAITLMTELGFVLIEAWPAWRHPVVGEVLHFDLLFRRGRMAV